MIKNVASVGLPVLETMHIRKNRICPEHLRNAMVQTADATSAPKRLSIISGIYGDELEGQYICFCLNQILQEHIDQLNGIVDIYPVINPLGLESIRRGVPSFDIDINRSFPGNPNGNMLEYSAAKIVEDIKGSDLCIDLHSSNIFLREIPQVRIREENKDLLLPYAKWLNCDFIWIHESATVYNSSFAYAMNHAGVPTLAVEMGSGMRITREFGEQLVTGLLNILKQLGMWSGEVQKVRTPIISSDGEVSYIHAEASGIFLPNIEHWKNVKKGDVIGRIVNSLSGSIEEEILAPMDGTVFTLREYPVVYSGSLIARILGGDH